MDKKNRGQSLVEFALIIPVLLTVFFALIDGAFLVQAYLTLNHATREAARFAVTYQPVQGECYEHDFQGEPVGGYPWCSGFDGGGFVDVAAESEGAWDSRRVEMIKLIARENALGLRIPCPETQANCPTDGPGLFQVRVWGDPGFGQAPVEDFSGLQGTSVFVHVVHNVPLITPVAFLLSPTPYIQLSSSAEMVNEGTFIDGAEPPEGGADGCVGISCYVGDVDVTIQNPGTVTPPPETPVGGETPTPEGPGDSTPSPTPSPDYTLSLSPQGTIFNELPDDRYHIFTARVLNQYGRGVENVLVSFRTEEGSFQYSGTGSKIDTVYTGDDGRAQTAVYANRPLTTTIEAWLDYNANGVVDAGEPSDSATKIFRVADAYLVVSDYNPVPNTVIAVNIMDHLPGDNPYSLWWCPITGTNVVASLAYPLNVEVTSGDLLDIPVQVPDNVMGTYRIESHTGDGGANACGNAVSLRAYSSPILIQNLPPDLQITAMEIVDPPEVELAAGKPLTVQLRVENMQPVEVEDVPFDVDVYPHLDDPPYVGLFTTGKQWIESFGPLESKVLTYVITAGKLGLNKVWAQVDTSDYIDEGDIGGEDNNVFGPLEFETCSGSDDFDDGLRDVWSQAEIGSVYYSDVSVNGAGQLEVTSRSPSGLWGGYHNFFYVYQTFNGDFDARLRIIDHADVNQWSKVGLHVRESLDRRAAFVMSMVTNDRSPGGSQIGYRNWTGGGTDRVVPDETVGLPYWVRIVREGNDYDFYSSQAAEPSRNDWDYEASHTNPSSLGLIGIANAGYNGSKNARSVVDDFVLCRGSETQGDGGDDIKPPGLVQCEELIKVPGFEGNADTVFEYWKAGETGAFRRASEQFFQGSFALRLHASLGTYPCTQSILEPYLYQEIDIPSELYAQTTLAVKLHYLVTGSDLECSNLDSPDADDQFFMRVRDDNGADIAAFPPQLIASGGTISNVWHTAVLTLNDHLNLHDYAGGSVQLYWDATHDEDYDGTYFYIDEVSAQLCTVWEVPPIDPNKGSFGGVVSALDERGAVLPLPGATVWAYTQDGSQYQTVSIQDGSYHFYNLPPGTYTVYGEAWVDGALRTAVYPSLALAAGDMRDDIDLPLR